ncbi:hypothetical protein EC988_000539 [Linderina pennispora]|nr:hypothetical protein EC988_000539 [Linderina pennispora]
MFQCEDEVDEMCRAIKDYMTELGEFVETGMRKADVLPSPWKEFEPFATRSVADLLNVAKSEHRRIAGDIVPMTQLKLKLDIERELLLASGSEADKALASGDLVQRCEQYMHDGERASSWTSSVEAHAVNLSGAVLSHLEEPGQVRHFGDVMEQLRQQWAALAENRRDQQSQDLEIAAQSIGPLRQAADEAMHRLAEEQAALADLSAMWAVVATNLERDNKALEKKRSGLESAAETSAAAATDGGRQVIHPGDTLALSLRQLLDAASQIGKGGFSPLPYRRSAATGMNENSPASEASQRLASMPDGADQPWPGDGAFTSWDSLCSDAAVYAQIRARALDAVASEAKAAEGVEGQLNCSLRDLEAALHGGEVRSGSEEIGVMTVVRVQWRGNALISPLYERALMSC